MAGASESDRVRAARIELLDTATEVSDELLARAIEYVGDVGVAVDAIRMRPRPGWLEQLIGPAEEN